jgi:hypothetical protein
MLKIPRVNSKSNKESLEHVFQPRTPEEFSAPPIYGVKEEIYD